MKIQHILFDADGVVIQGKLFSLQYQERYNISNDLMLPFFTGIFQECLIGKRDLKEAIAPYLKNWKWNKSPEDLLQLWFDLENHPNEKMIRSIRTLQAQGIRCSLTTNQEKYRSDYMRNTMGFEEIFDHLFSSADIGYKKPNESFYSYIFEHIFQEQAIERQDVLFIDDSEENTKAAKKFGFTTHIFTNNASYLEFINTLSP